MRPWQTATPQAERPSPESRPTAIEALRIRRDRRDGAPSKRTRRGKQLRRVGVLMRNFPRHPSSCVVLCVAAVSACSEQHPLPGERHWLSTHFDYATTRDDPAPCKAVLHTLERHWQAMHRFLGLPAAGAPPIPYWKFETPVDLLHRAHCSPFNTSCYFSETGIHTASVFEAHELVHAYLDPLGQSFPTLEEGLAQAISCGAKALASPTALGPEQLFDAAGWQTSDLPQRDALYGAAAWLVGHLLRRHGPEPLLAWYSRVSPSSSALQIADAFRHSYGESLPTAWQRAVQSGAVRCLPIWECFEESSTTDVTQAPQRACDGSSLFTPLVAERPTWFFQPSAGLQPDLGSCSLSNPVPDFGGTVPSELTIVGVGPGRYFSVPTSAERLRSSSQSSAQRGPVRAPVHRFDPLHAADCRSIEPLVTGSVHHLGFAIAPELFSESPIPGVGEITFRWLDPAFDQSPRYTVTCSAGVQVRVCTDCSVASCTQLCDSDVSRDTEIAPAAPIIVRVTNEHARTWARVRFVRLWKR